MNESELGRALRGTVAKGSPPLALDATGMLSHARKARVRHRASLAAAASVLAVVALGGAAALTGNLAFGGNGGGGGTPGIQAGGGPPACAQGGPNSTQGTATAVPPTPKLSYTPPRPTGSPTGSAPRPTPSCNTETPWPSGQQDRTAAAGPHHQQALTFESTLRASLPHGAQLRVQLTQGQFDEYVGTTEVWEYSVYGGVVLPKHGTASIVLDIFSPRPGDRRGLCEIAGQFQSDPGPNCAVHTVQGKEVAFATLAPGDSTGGYSPQPDHWVVYRAPNGTVVLLGVGRDDGIDGTPPATADVFTLQQMADLVASGRFDI